MQYSKPEYFDDFYCTADRCPDTCCAGWQIMIDEDSLKKYSHVKGEFGKRLRRSIDWDESAFCQREGRCAFLNEENLCDLYTALGSDALCDTCSRYPRHVEEYEGLREWSLSLSCPVAAEVILGQRGVPALVNWEDTLEEELEEEFEDFDLLLFSQLEEARSVVFENLGTIGEDITLEDRMCQALSMAEKLQVCLDEGRYWELEEIIEGYRKGRDWAVNEVQKAGKTECGEYDRSMWLYDIMRGLERLRPEWTDVLEEMEETLYRIGMVEYRDLKERFETYLREHPAQQKQWENAGIQLFHFFVYTYFCGAVYDDWIYSKMALAVYSVTFIRELLLTRWVKRGKLDPEDYVELSYRYAREIEHSDQNLNELEEKFHFF